MDKGFASVSGTRSQAKAGVGNKIPKDSLGAVHLTVDSDLSNDRKKLAASDPRVESRNTCGTLENDLGNKRQMQEHGASGPVPVHFEGPHLKRALKENVSSKRNSRFVRVHWDVEGKEPGKSEGIKEGRPVNEETSMRMSDELLGKEAEVNISKVQFPSQEDGQEKLPTRRSKVEMATQTLEEGDLEELPVKQKVQTSDSQALRDATSAEGQSENLRIERANVRQKVLPAVVNGSGIKLRGCITTVPIDRPDAHRIRIQNVGKARVMRVCK